MSLKQGSKLKHILPPHSVWWTSSMAAKGRPLAEQPTKRELSISANWQENYDLNYKMSLSPYQFLPTTRVPPSGPLWPDSVEFVVGKNMITMWIPDVGFCVRLLHVTKFGSGLDVRWGLLSLKLSGLNVWVLCLNRVSTLRGSVEVTVIILHQWYNTILTPYIQQY